MQIVIMATQKRMILYAGIYSFGFRDLEEVFLRAVVFFVVLVVFPVDFLAGGRVYISPFYDKF